MVSCSLSNSWDSPLQDPYENSLNPCFLSFIDAVIYLAFIIPLVYKIVTLAYYNHYGPYPIKYSFGSVFNEKSVGIYQLMKLNSVVVHIALNLVLLIFNFSINDVKSIGLLIHCIVLTGLVLPLHLLEPTRNMVASAPLLLFWTVNTVLSLIVLVQDSFSPYKVYIPGDEASIKSSILVVEILLFLNSVSIFSLETFLYYPSRELVEYFDLNEWDIRSVRNVFQRFLFYYMQDTIKIAQETNTLDSDKLPSFTIELDNQIAYSQFVENWNQSVKNAELVNEKLKKKGKPQTAKPSLFRPVLKQTKWFFMRCLIADLSEFAAQICQPYLLRAFLLFATNRFISESAEIKKQPIIKGFAIATGIYAVSVIRYIAFNRSYFNIIGLADVAQTALSSHTYQKGMRLSPKERKNKTVSEIVNNMAQDVQSVSNSANIIINIVSQPLRLVFYMLTLYNFLGVAALAGLSTALVLIPIASSCFTFVYKQYNILMKHKDSRAKLMGEILNSIKSIKLYSWEFPMMERLKAIRNGKELKVLRTVGILNTVIDAIWDIIPFGIAISSFTCAAVYGKVLLTPDVVFPALTLFSLLSEPILQLPSIFSNIAECRVSLERLVTLFTMEELEVEGFERTKYPAKAGEQVVTIKSATFLWTKEVPKEEPVEVEGDNEEEPTINPIALSNINFSAKKGELSCIVGRVGTGKTTLLKAILGSILVENNPETVLKVNGSIAYCSQNAWILNASVRDNILFGRKYDKAYYNETIAACELIKDFEVLPDGDRTIVGEKGISLSGGQKARISLARAVYAKADIYILDDILSAVDTHVGKHIIKNVLGKSGLLSTKTLILATNSVPVLHEADSINLLVGGRITETGTFAEVMSTDSELARLIKEFGKQSSEHDDEVIEKEAIEEIELDKQRHEIQAKEIQKESQLENQKHSETSSQEVQSYVPEEENIGLTKVTTNATVAPSFVSFGHDYEGDFDDDPNVVKKTGDTDEIQSRDNVNLAVYIEYMKACGYGYMGMYLLFATCGILVGIVNSFVLKHWSEDNAKNGENVRISFYLISYAIIGVSGVLLTLGASLVIWIYVVINGSTYFHDTMAQSIFRSPMSFFETTPVGRILNRFTDDIAVIDSQIIWTIIFFVSFVIRALGVFSIVVYNLPIMFLVLAALLYFYDSFRRRFIPASRELKRLRSSNKSPVFSHLQESVSGVETIIAYDQLDRFTHKNSTNLNRLIRTDQSNLACNRWLSMRLQGLSAVIVYCCTLMILLSFASNKPIAPGLAGFIMTYVLDVTTTLNAIVRTYADIETRSVTIERLVEYCKLKPEAEMIIEETRPPTNWPQHGAIEFKGYETKYRENLDPVLKDIKISINAGEKIGIVGRTGAGKSTLTLALFRIIEATNGHIEIDGINTSTLGLFDLRSRLNIIPQDSQAFDGTVRENLDPFSKYTDEQLWKVLELSHLKEHIESMKTEGKEDEDNDTAKKNDEPTVVATGLEARITEGGSNLSAGQKQLMCLARALLNPSKVLILDEATASVDVQTDKIVQETIRSEFSDKTILTIAHRIETIMDSDKILVLERGEVKEFDKPEELLKDTNTIFYSLCKEGGHI